MFCMNSYCIKKYTFVQNINTEFYFLFCLHFCLLTYWNNNNNMKDIYAIVGLRYYYIILIIFASILILVIKSIIVKELQNLGTIKNNFRNTT